MSTACSLEEARFQLATMAAARDFPPLTVDELEVELLRVRTVDRSGRWTITSGYVPTWDLNTAAARLWELKAAKVALKFDLSTGNRSLSRSQMRAACLEMAKTFRKRVTGSPRMNGDSYNPFLDPATNPGWIALTDAFDEDFTPDGIPRV